MAGQRIRWQLFLASPRGPVAVLVLAALVTGCKSGSWGAKPSWWSFGSTSPSPSLTAAPEFNKDVTKPSEVAKPYPTTNTPEGYSLGAADRASGAPGGGPVLEPTSITYGSTPPPAEAQPQAMPLAPAQAAGPGGPQPGGIGPQVGPYASLQPAPSSPAVDPAAAVTAGLGAAPAFGEAAPPAAAPRVADARGSSGWAASPPPPPSTATDPRYGASNGSRFSSGFQPSAIEPPPAAAAFAPPAAAPFAQPEATAPPPAAAPFAQPGATPPPPAAAPPANAGEALPGSLPPPRRRPDPGYRPGGTSSYRPSRSILAEDEAAPGGVVPVSFEAGRTAGE